jgi:polysaccharide export outer membrane protein
MASHAILHSANQLLRFIAMLGAALALVGCTSGRLPSAPASAVTDSYSYLIGPLDSLNIVVWRHPDLSGPVTVRPDGKISTPLVAEIQAAGNTPKELSQLLQKEFGTYVKDAVVSVVVTSFQGASGEQIRIIGEAARPQAIPFRQGMTLLDVMIQVGGLTDFADGNGAVLVRGKEGGKQYNVRLKDLLKRGDISANVDVRPGDVLIVPQGWF